MTKPRIVLVEDENLVALEIQDLLQVLGYEVCGRASSGEEAIRKAAETNPDLALMDIRLKGDMDGIEAAGHIRAHFEIPIVYLTAYADEGTLQRAKATEPFGYVIKPFEERELHIAVEMALYKHAMEKKLVEREQWLATTLKSIDDAVLATDARGLIVFMNPRAQALTGWPQGEVMGRGATEVVRLIQEDTLALVGDPVAQVLREEAVISPRDDALLVARDHTRTPVEYSVAPLRDDKGRVTGVVLVFRDVTERRRAAQELAHRYAQAQTLREVMLAAASTLDFDQVLQRSALALRASMQVDTLSFAATNLGGKEFLPQPSRNGGSLPKGEGTCGSQDDLSCGQGHHIGQPMGVSDMRADPFPPQADPQAGSELALPVHVNGRPGGVLTLKSRQPEAFAEDEQSFYAAIAGQLGVALQNAHLHGELQRHAEELATALAQLQELDRLKTEFVQNVTHELRTPLGLIVGYVELLADKECSPLSAQQQHFLQIVQRQVYILQNLVQDISLMLYTQSSPLPKEPVALDDLVREAVEDYATTARDAGLTLRAELGPELPTLRGASTYLRRVLDNLLSNAVKFTPSGGQILIRTGLEQDRVVLRVADTGIGIAPDQHLRIFDRFYQVNGATNRRYEGMGLGLALVKEIVEAHHGTVSVDSELGRGSTFVVSLPANGSNPPAGRGWPLAPSFHVEWRAS
jgi:PAS domain S-box-containing protein